MTAGGVSEACEVFTSRRAGPQALALTVLVTMELLKALSAVSLTQSMFSVSPLKNPYLLLGVAVPFLLHLAILYVPALNGIFGVHPLSRREWKVVLAFAAPILVVEEILKGVGRARASRDARARAQQPQQQQY
jgi:Ca2+-transporting ATPase